MEASPLRVLGLAVALTLPALASPRAASEHLVIDGADGLRLQAELYRPEGAGPFPAVVALHGCGGLYDRGGALNARHSDWGERLAARGFIVLMPDSFGSRGLGSQCRNAARDIRPGRERANDAVLAKDFLQGRSDVRPEAVSLLGWSNGGTTVLYAVSSARKTSTVRPDFARAVAFYPGCRIPAERGWRGRVPLLILVGGADDWTGAQPCEALAASAKAAGDAVDIVVYPGAYHDFDHPNLPVRIRKGLAYTVSGDGTGHIGTDPAARADALRRVPEFLAR